MIHFTENLPEMTIVDHMVHFFRELTTGLISEIPNCITLLVLNVNPEQILNEGMQPNKTFKYASPVLRPNNSRYSYIIFFQIILIEADSDMSFDRNSKIHITIDAGETWQKASLPFHMDPSTIKFSAVDADR